MFPPAILRPEMFGQRSGRTKVPRIFRILLRIFPEFFEEFSCFVSQDTETSKIHQKSPPFFNAKFPGNYEKNIHKLFLGSRQSKEMVAPNYGRLASLFFLQENLHAHKIPRFRGGYFGFGEGVGSANVTFMGVGILLIKFYVPFCSLNTRAKKHKKTN